MIEQAQDKAPEQTRTRTLAPYVYQRSYRMLCTRTREEQAQLLERLRYRTYPVWALRQRLMQRLGDFGRQVLPAVRLLRF